MRKEWWWILALTTLALSEEAFSRPQRHKIGTLQKWKCQEDGCDKRFQDGFLIDIDHIIPLSKGGKDVLTNGQCLCLDSHLRKHEEGGDMAAVRMIKHRIQETGGRTLKWRIKNNK